MAEDGPGRRRGGRPAAPSGTAEIPRLDEQVCFALYAATNEVVRAYRPLLRRIGLTYPQYLVMLVLWRDETTMRALAARLRLSASAVVPLVDRLEAAGLVARLPDPTDRRRIRVVPTSAGRALEDAAVEVQAQVGCRVGLDDAALATLRRELHALADRLAAGAEPSEASGARGGRVDATG